MEEKNLSAIFGTLNGILKNTDIKDVSAEGAGFSELPDGYYLCEVASAELTESKKHDPMVKIKYKIVENGEAVTIDGDGDVQLSEISGTKGRYMFQNFVLKDEMGVKRFVSDMLKFEGETAGEPLLDRESFTTAEVLEESLEILVGMRIFAQQSTTPAKNEGEADSHWTNLISWKRAEKLGLC